MRLLAVALVALVALTPAADARKRHKHHRLHGKVSHVRAKAPASWLFAKPAPTATPAPAAPASPAATPTPAGSPAPATTPVATPTATPASTLPAQNPRSVSVRSTEFQFTLSQATVSAGAVRVQFDNSRAEDPHSLSVDGASGDGVDDYWAFATQDPGTVTQRTLTLQPGSYVLFCPILDHEARGMRATLTVR